MKLMLKMEEAEQYCFEDFESEHVVAAAADGINGSSIPEEKMQTPSGPNIRPCIGQSHPPLRGNLSQGDSENAFDVNRAMTSKTSLRGPEKGKRNQRDFSHQMPKTFNARGDLIAGPSFGNPGLSKKSRYLKNATAVKKQREWRKPKLFTKSTYLHRTLSDGSTVPEEPSRLGYDVAMYPGSVGNLESKSVEDRLQQLSQEDRLSVRTRLDYPRGGGKGRDGIFQKGKLRPSKQSAKDFKSRDYLFREESIYSPLKGKPLLQTFSMSEDQLDKHNPLFVNGSSLNNITPLEDPPSHFKGQSLPSEIDRITLFGPRDLITSQGSLSSHKETDEEFSTESSRSSDSIISKNGNRLKRLSQGISEPPDFVDTLLGRPPREKFMEPRINLNGKLATKGHRAVTRSNTAPAPSLNEDTDFLKEPSGKLCDPQVRRPMLSISNKGAAWRLEDDDAYQPNPSPSLEDTPFAQTSTQLYYTAPPQGQTTAGDKSPKNGSNGSLVKLARRFSQRGERKEVRPLPLIADDSQPQHRQRSVSVDSGDVRKAHSMESLVQAGDKSKSATSIPPSPSAPIRLQRSWSAKKRHGSNLEVDTIMERQPDKTKRGSKQISEFQAFFDAVEHQDLDEVESILKWNTVDVNQPNNDDITALDIAIMTNNMPMARLLLANGARENSRFLMKDARITKLNTLISNAERIIKDLSSRLVNSSKVKEVNTKDQLKDWEWQLQLLTRMKKGFESARAPDVPVSVQLSVASSTALHVTFEEPHNVNGASVTRYKIEWSTSEDFQLLSGEHILYDVRNLSYTIQGLIKGTTYYVRVSAFNMKGFGPSQVSSPHCAVPSSWKDCDNSAPRFNNQLFLVDELFRKVRDSRPADSGEMRMSSPRASPSQVRKTVRKSLKNFFQSAPKFQKHLKRGIYLANILYHEDKIMVTTEDHIPIVEVDENFPSNYQQDFLWFMKVAKTWEDVDLLRTDLSHSNSSSATVLFRNKLLSAVAHLQSVLCVQDLGQLYFEPIRDNHGTMIWLLMSHIKEPRMLPSTAVKWIPLNRMLKRKSMSVETPSASELLMNSLPEKLVHHRSSGNPLTRGLYLAYLRMRSSVDTIRVQVPEKQPNILPHLKIRDNPNVSQEEWQWLHNLDLNEIKSKPSVAQEQFQQQLADGAKELLKTVNVEERDSLAHRICDLEVIELNDEVSIILLFPAPGNVCLGPGTSDEWLIGTDYISVPVPVFELAHLSTYHPNFTRRFARLSSILEMDNILSQQTLREAFSDEELTDAKDRQDQIGNFLTNLEMIWKSMRWLTDILQYARDRQVTGGVPLSVLYAPPPSPLEMNDNIGNTANQQTEDIGDTVSSLNFNNNLTSSQLDVESFMKQKPTSKLTSGILKVYPAYQSGLAKGTSVKLHVTNRTTCREIINLVIQQLNKTIESRKLDAPIYNEDQWSEFCLIASMGNIEHTLLDEFCPLQLQNPWTKGQLLVRPKEANVTTSIGPSTCV